MLRCKVEDRSGLIVPLAAEADVACHQIRWPSNMQTAGRGGGVCFLLSAHDTMVGEFDS